MGNLVAYKTGLDKKLSLKTTSVKKSHALSDIQRYILIT